MRLVYLLLTGLVALCRIEAQTKKPRIYYLHVKSDIRYRFATTVVTSKVVNPDLASHESTFNVTLPNEAFISNFTLTVGNETYVGNVTTKETAREVYENDKRLGKSAAHVSVKPRETNTFNIQVNVAAEQKVTFELRYQELLQRKLGSYNQVIYVQPGEPVADLSIEVEIEESRNITKLKVPPIKSDLFSIETQKEADAAITVTRPSAERAHIWFTPTLDTQIAGGPHGLECQFKVKYDVDRKPDGGEILMVDGYFVHFFAPGGLEQKPKDVVFILDKSGSMSGGKIVQLKQAMSTILSQIPIEDRLNILPFSSSTHSWETVEKLIPATPANIERATTYVNQMYAGGGTNIQDALKRGVALLDERTDKTRAPVLIFLTDGRGNRNPEVVLKNVIKFNEDKIPIFALAFGRGADYNFIKRLAAQNHGFGRKIYEDIDAAKQISDFYSEISAVLLQDVTFKYLPGSVDENTLTKTIVPNLFDGSEIVVCGRIANEVTYDIKPNVIATGLNGPVSLKVPTDGEVQLNFTQNTDIYAITEKIWAYLTIKQWLQQMDASTNKIEQQELKENVTAMALKYNFVTPFTSMVVSLPDKLQTSPVDLLPDSPESSQASFSSTGSRGRSMMASLASPGSMSAQPVVQNSGNFHRKMSHPAMSAQLGPKMSGASFGSVQADLSNSISSPKVSNRQGSSGMSSVTTTSTTLPSTVSASQTTTPPKTTPRTVSASQTTTPPKTTPSTVSASQTTTPSKTTPSTVSASQTTTPPKTTPSAVSSSQTTTPPKTTPSTVSASQTTTPPKTTPSTVSAGQTTTPPKTPPSTVSVIQTTTPASSNNMKSTTPRHESTSAYTLVGVKNIALPLCLDNPSQTDETKRYILFQDLDSGNVVSAGFKHSLTGPTRITYVKIAAQTVTEVFPSHLVENGVRRDWNSNTFYTYVHGSQGSGVKLEVTSLANNRLIVHFDYTENTSQNIDGSLALPISGAINDSPNPQGLPNNQKKELSMSVKKMGSLQQLVIPVELSSVMNCWIVRSSLLWNLQTTV